MNELIHIDLFSGIGGFALAARWAGFQTVCFSEVDPYASAVLKKHWPDVPNLGDITKADFVPYTGATLLTGGFPCQPFSIAGKRRGKADDRFLWPAMLSVIGAVRPAWIVGENVAGFSQMVQFDRDLEMEAEGAAVGEIGTVVDRMGRGVADEALGQLEQLGYAVQAFIVPAVAVDARHRRDRVWIVAHSTRGINERGRARAGVWKVEGGNGEENETLADADGLRGGEERGALQRTQGEAKKHEGRRRWAKPSDGGQASTDAESQGLPHWRQPEQQADARETVREASQPGPERCGGSIWPVEPGVDRMVNGLPNRVDRIKGLGNAIVPQVAYQILKAIAQIESA